MNVFLTWWSSERLREEARLWAQQRYGLALERHDIPEEVKEDLADRAPRFSLARDGRRVSNYLLSTDLLHGRASPVTLWGASVVLAIVAGWTAAMPLAWYWLPALVCPFGLYWSSMRHDTLAVAIDAALSGESSVLGTASSHAAIRMAQARRANADPTPFFALGRSTGAFSGAGDWFGADAGRVIGLTQADLSTHLFVTGATGSGKTSAALRPLAHKWAGQTNAGMLIIDGKGDLPKELVGLPGYSLIDPAVSAVALLSGLEPHDVVHALHPSGKEGEADFWSSSASTLLYNACVLAHRGDQLGIPGASWTILGVRKLVTETQTRGQVAAAILASETYQPSPSLESALDYFAFELEEIPENTRGGIISTALSWLSPLAEHDALAEWCTTTSETPQAIDVTEVLRGRRYGLDVPVFRYGAAANAISALLRAQVYRAAKLRGSRPHWEEGEVDCLLMIDEAALALGQQENDMLPIARSLGISFCCACQNIEQMNARFGSAGASALLDQFRSLLMFQSSPQTYQYVRARAGVAVMATPAQRASPAFSQASSIEAGGFHRSGSSRYLKQPLVNAASRVLSDESCVTWGVRSPLSDEAPHLSQMSAIAVLNRAGSMRREIIVCEPTFYTGKDES